MFFCFLAVLGACWVCGVKSHNGIVHHPGTSSSLLVGPAILDDTSKSVVTVMNYGLNYIRMVDADGHVVHEAQANRNHFPMSAVMYSEPGSGSIRTFAVCDTGDRFEFTLDGVAFDPGCGPATEGKFYQYASDSSPLKYFGLATGSVYDVDFSGSAPSCTLNSTLSWNGYIPWVASWKAEESQQAPLFYAHAYYRGCAYFIHPDEQGAVILDAPGCGIRSRMLNDACNELKRTFVYTLHEGADLFIRNNALYISNGETSSSCIRGNPAASQNDHKLAGKVLRVQHLSANSVIFHTVAAGLRHPFSAAVMLHGPKAGSVAIADTGDAEYDEINMFDSASNNNYGWPIIEGFQLRQAHTRHDSSRFTTLEYPYYSEHRPKHRTRNACIIIGVSVAFLLACSFLWGKYYKKKHVQDWDVVAVLVAVLLVFAMPAWLWLDGHNTYHWPIHRPIRQSANSSNLTDTEIILAAVYGVLFAAFTLAACMALSGRKIRHDWLASAVFVFIAYAAVYEATASGKCSPSPFLISGIILVSALTVWCSFRQTHASKRGKWQALVTQSGKGIQYW